jgi:cell wall-associated NlpC family hydrolase
MPAISRMRTFVALPFVLLLLLSGLALTQVSVAPKADALTRSQKIADGVRIAKNQLGDPYRYGAAGPGAFDCSGLVYYSMRKAGIAVPRSSGAQASYARRISKANLRPGDLMFFTNGGGVYHAAIFVGRKDGHIVMLHSPHSGDHVRYARPWTDGWFAATLR